MKYLVSLWVGSQCSFKSFRSPVLKSKNATHNAIFSLHILEGEIYFIHIQRIANQSRLWLVVHEGGSPPLTRSKIGGASDRPVSSLSWILSPGYEFVQFPYFKSGQYGVWESVVLAPCLEGINSSELQYTAGLQYIAIAWYMTYKPYLWTTCRYIRRALCFSPLSSESWENLDCGKPLVLEPVFEITTIEMIKIATNIMDQSVRLMALATSEGLDRIQVLPSHLICYYVLD
jgi:hypothetical protein